jgi:carboxylesterase type B
MEIDRKTGNKNIYRYKFDMAAPPNKSHWGSQASHADDIEYVFGTLDTQPGVVWRPEDYALSEQMMSYWTNFARTSDPNGIDGNGQRLPAFKGPETLPNTVSPNYALPIGGCPDQLQTSTVRPGTLEKCLRLFVTRTIR